MSSSFASTSHQIGLDLYGLLQEIDPARWQEDMADASRAKLACLHDKLQGLGSSETGPLADVIDALRQHVNTAGLPSSSIDLTGHWQAFRERAEPLYGELSHALSAHNVQLPMLRPTNYLRNVQHIGAAAGILVLLHYVLPNATWRIAVASSAFGFAVFLEVGRYLVPSFNRFLMSILGRIAHPHESHRVNSSSWFIVSLFVLSFFDVVYGTVALAILGAADPAAAVIGRRFGRRELVNGRTLEGTLTFWAVGTAVSVLALFAWFDFTPAHTLLMGGTAAGCAAAAELFSKRIDDNLSIPVAAAIGLWLVL